MPDLNPFQFRGISQNEVASSRNKYGSNSTEQKNKNTFLLSLIETVKEPMFLLLVACAIIYFLLGEFSEAWFMLGAIFLVSGISLYQDDKSRKAINSLRAYTQPKVTVIRENELLKIASEDIVVGDFVVASEGELVAADGQVKQINDFTVNESILTGEAFSIYKSLEGEDSLVYSGTLVESGQCVFEVTAIGSNTRLGQIGKSLESIETEKTPLELQIQSFVKKMALIGIGIFLLIWLVNFVRYGGILSSLLKGLTIAMSVLPEEIPVAFATFMALGAWRLMKSGVLVKHTSTVEALGTATVLCTDKTGTITENRMELFHIYDLRSDAVYNKDNWKNDEVLRIVSAAMWSSEIVPFDPMEKAIHAAYSGTISKDERPLYKMIHEYPLGGTPPMMTHLFENGEGQRIIASKGAVEAIMANSSLSQEQKNRINATATKFAVDGLRVLAVATSEFAGSDYPKTQQEYNLNFLGLVGFYDPPKKNIDKVFQALTSAGISLKMITGDNAATAVAIARQANFPGYENVITSNELSALDDKRFDAAVLSKSIFARMFPDLKLKVIESLKRQGEIVAMTGDGVNDGPALKAAHIGISMGKRGSEIAKQASSLILTNDDLGNMVDAVAMGRKIYSNLKKAIQYIISIHIPIILTVAVPSVLGWIYPSIFTPIHVIFLELVMGPTCSIVYENEPLEKNSMLQPPRKVGNSFFSLRELTVSIFQGLGIAIAVLFVYQYEVQQGQSESTVRSMVFTTLIFANVLLAMVNRSFYYSVFTTATYKNRLFTLMIILTLGLLALLLYIPVLSVFFSLIPLTVAQLAVCAIMAMLSVSGFEIYKLTKRMGTKHV